MSTQANETVIATDSPAPISEKFSATRAVIVSELSPDQKEQYYNLILSNDVKLQYTDDKFVANIRLIGPTNDDENGSDERKEITPEATERSIIAPTTASKKCNSALPLEQRIHRLQYGASTRQLTFHIAGVARFDYSTFPRFCSLIGNDNDVVRPQLRSVSWLMRVIEDIYDARFAHEKNHTIRKEQQKINRERTTGNPDVAEDEGDYSFCNSFPVFVAQRLTTVIGLKSLTDQTCWDLLCNIDRNYKDFLEIETFRYFLQEKFGEEDLLFFLYLRSIISKSLKVSFSGRWTLVHGPERQPKRIFLSYQECILLSHKVFGVGYNDLGKDFLQSLVTSRRIIGKVTRREDTRKIEVRDLLYLAVMGYHKTQSVCDQTPGDETAAAEALLKYKVGRSKILANAINTDQEQRRNELSVTYGKSDGLSHSSDRNRSTTNRVSDISTNHGLKERVRVAVRHDIPPAIFVTPGKMSDIENDTSEVGGVDGTGGRGSGSRHSIGGISNLDPGSALGQEKARTRIKSKSTGTGSRTSSQSDIGTGPGSGPGSGMRTRSGPGSGPGSTPRSGPGSGPGSDVGSIPGSGPSSVSGVKDRARFSTSKAGDKKSPSSPTNGSLPLSLPPSPSKPLIRIAVMQASISTQTHTPPPLSPEPNGTKSASDRYRAVNKLPETDAEREDREAQAIILEKANARAIINKINASLKKKPTSKVPIPSEQSERRTSWEQYNDSISARERSQTPPPSRNQGHQSTQNIPILPLKSENALKLYARPAVLAGGYLDSNEGVSSSSSSSSSCSKSNSKGRGKCFSYDDSDCKLDEAEMNRIRAKQRVTVQPKLTSQSLLLNRESSVSAARRERRKSEIINPVIDTREIESSPRSLGTHSPMAKSPGAKSPGVNNNGPQSPARRASGLKSPSARNSGPKSPGVKSPGAKNLVPKSPGPKSPGARIMGSSGRDRFQMDVSGAGAESRGNRRASESSLGSGDILSAREAEGSRRLSVRCTPTSTSTSTNPLTPRNGSTPLSCGERSGASTPEKPRLHAYNFPEIYDQQVGLEADDEMDMSNVSTRSYDDKNMNPYTGSNSPLKRLRPPPLNPGPVPVPVPVPFVTPTSRSPSAQRGPKAAESPRDSLIPPPIIIPPIPSPTIIMTYPKSPTNIASASNFSNIKNLFIKTPAAPLTPKATPFALTPKSGPDPFSFIKSKPYPPPPNPITPKFQNTLYPGLSPTPITPRPCPSTVTLHQRSRSAPGTTTPRENVPLTVVPSPAILKATLPPPPPISTSGLTISGLRRLSFRLLNQNEDGSAPETVLGALSGGKSRSPRNSYPSSPALEKQEEACFTRYFASESTDSSPPSDSAAFTESRTASPRTGAATMPPSGVVMREVMAISQRNTPKSSDSAHTQRLSGTPKRFSFITSNLFGPEQDTEEPTESLSSVFAIVSDREDSILAVPASAVTDALSQSQKSESTYGEIKEHTEEDEADEKDRIKETKEEESTRLAKLRTHLEESILEGACGALKGSGFSSSIVDVITDEVTLLIHLKINQSLEENEFQDLDRNVLNKRIISFLQSEHDSLSEALKEKVFSMVEFVKTNMK